ncbi:amidohydrolase family protein [Miniphocaeibacter massiliensis]|uniref:amidohydrolase family protein n=1 Tax=Miniphocaeibacter massiliensis TaxID=2041841 RepID=UPI000C1C3731|nr:amidohydrolase family protein [Miniphocaeibacter massiliensis]
MKVFDAHLHIIDDKFPLQENNGFIPENFNIDSYKKALDSFELESVGGAIVSGSFQGYDQSYLISALSCLNSHGYIGVTQLPITTTDSEIKLLHEKGVRAIRFNVFRGGSEDIIHLFTLAKRVYNLCGWSTELYIDVSKITPPQEDIILSLPRVSIDHLGMSSKGNDTLLRLVRNGVKVKSTGFGRINFEPLNIMKEIHSISKDALLFGTDLPSTRAKRPFSSEDIKFIVNNFQKEDFERILYKNSKDWYINYFS